MSKYAITSGVIHAPQKTVLYGPEGIGKTTFASKFPGVVFIDTEGSTKKLDVQRLPKPTSWSMLLDMVNSVRKGEIPCGTLAIDTADWAEALCVRAVCDRANLKGIEDFGYGKGYVYVKEEFGRLLDQLDGVVDAGVNVVITAHAQITKFEQPDEMGAYDRWTMKTSKQVAPLLREWCDMLLFANYKTLVVKDGDGKNAKSKAQGGRRVMYTTHHPCWDAKNRDGLPDEMPFDFESIRSIIPAKNVPQSQPQTVQQTAPAGNPHPQHRAEDDIIQQEKPKPEPQPQEKPKTQKTQNQQTGAEALDKDLREKGVPDNLRQLMVANGVSAEALQQVVGNRGYFPADMPIKDYPQDFIDGCLIAAWKSVYDMVVAACDDIPF